MGLYCHASVSFIVEVFVFEIEPVPVVYIMDALYSLLKAGFGPVAFLLEIIVKVKDSSIRINTLHTFPE